MSRSLSREYPTIDLEIVVPKTLRAGGWVDLEPDEALLPAWPIPQTSAPNQADYVSTRQAPGVEVTVEGSANPHSLRFVVTRGRLLPDQVLHVILGDRDGGGPGWSVTEVPDRLPFRLNFRSDLDSFAPDGALLGSGPVYIARTFVVAPGRKRAGYVARALGGPVPQQATARDWTRIGVAEDPPRVRSVQYVVQHGPYRQDWPTHDQYEVFSVHEGDAVLNVGTAQLHVAPSSIVLIKPLLPHRTAIESGHCIKGVNIYFQAGCLKEHVDRLNEVDLASPSAPSAGRAASLAVDILEENRQLLRGAHNCADAYLQLLLVECLRGQGRALESRDTLPAAADTQVRARVEHCTRYIEVHYHEELTLELLAEELSVSPWHLSHTFSRQTGTTVSAYITDVRMRRAEDLVARSSRPLKEIAIAVGYSDEFYFSKVFRRHFGIPPGAYRKTQAGRQSTDRTEGQTFDTGAHSPGTAPLPH